MVLRHAATTKEKRKKDAPSDSLPVMDYPSYTTKKLSKSDGLRLSKKQQTKGRSPSLFYLNFFNILVIKSDNQCLHVCRIFGKIFCQFFYLKYNYLIAQRRCSSQFF